MPVVEAGGGGSGDGDKAAQTNDNLIFGSGTKQYTVTVLPDEVVEVIVKK